MKMQQHSVVMIGYFQVPLYQKSCNKKQKNSPNRFGDEIYKIGYQGFFGIDLIITKEDCYVIECNPRITGALPVLDMVQDQNQKPAFIGLHVLEFLADELPVKLNFKSLQSELNRENQKGAIHFFIVQKEDVERQVKETLSEGAYTIKDGSLTYLDERNHPDQLKHEDEFILAETPQLNRTLNQNGRLTRVVAIKEALEQDGVTTKSWVKEIEKLVEDTIK